MIQSSVGSKTFLLGEYLAIQEGPSIVLSTSPRFSLVISSQDEGVRREDLAIGVRSPAGKFMREYQSEFSRWNFRFHDPHAGLGGLGASSAQFALVYDWLHQNSKAEKSNPVYWRNLLSDYRRCAWDGVGLPPSGADVVAQITGGVCYFDGRLLEASRLNWGFAELSFTLIRTGVKLATHEHLKSTHDLNEDELSSLREIVLRAHRSLLNSDADGIVAAVSDYGSILNRHGWVAPGTLNLLNSLRADCPEVWAAKGCGAMGADVILALHSRQSAEKLRAWAAAKGLTVCATGAESLTEGLVTEAVKKTAVADSSFKGTTL